ncbi:MAG: hypothetical protein QXT73_07160 [Candidatus Methanomethylicaceae archaeon]
MGKGKREEQERKEREVWRLMEKSRWSLIEMLAPLTGLTEAEIAALMRQKVKGGANPEIVYRIGLNGRLRDNLEKLVVVGFLDVEPGPVGYPDLDKFRVSELAKKLLKARQKKGAR